MVNSIKKTLAGILVAGASLGLTGCDEEKAYTLNAQNYFLFSSSFHGCAPRYKLDSLEESAVIPTELKFMVGDFDANGKKEVALNYAGNNYLMKTNSAGDVYLQRFELVPPQIKLSD